MTVPQQPNPGDVPQCRACNGRVLHHRRLANHAPNTVLAALSVLAVIAAIVAFVQSSVGLLVGAGVLFAITMVLPRLGVLYWGGTRCTACGRVEMLR